MKIAQISRGEASRSVGGLTDKTVQFLESDVTSSGCLSLLST